MTGTDKPDFDCVMVPLTSHRLFWITFTGRLSVRRLAKAYEGFKSHPGRSVLVVNTDLEFGLTRMMGGMLDGVSSTSRAVCYSVPEALRWLRPGQAAELVAAYEAASPYSAGRSPG